MQPTYKERYQEYLKSAEWKSIKKLKLKLANFTCNGCNEKNRVMEVHHLTYERAGNELLTDLAVYCTECHKKAHSKDMSEWHTYLTLQTHDKPRDRLEEDLKFEKIINSIQG